MVSCGLTSLALAWIPLSAESNQTGLGDSGSFPLDTLEETDFGMAQSGGFALDTRSIHEVPPSGISESSGFQLDTRGGDL